MRCCGEKRVWRANEVYAIKIVTDDRKASNLMADSGVPLGSNVTLELLNVPKRRHASCIALYS
jgi:hypothetical protein